MRQRIAAILNLAVVVVVLVALFRPAGPAGAAIARWNRDVEQRRRVQSIWDSVAVGPRLDHALVDIRLVEFVDYECRICRLQHQVLTELIDSNRIAGIAVRHYPLAVYRRSEAAARASICAEQQGRFREMHHQLYTTSEWISDANWVREASTAGVPDLRAFAVCLDDGATQQRLARDVELARSIGVGATPVYAHRETGLIRGMLADSVLTQLAGVR